MLLKIVGIVLIIIGIVALATGGFSYKTKEKVVDLGPIEATAEQEKKVALPPALGIITLVGGIVLLMVGVRKKA